jgi:anti-sigma factor RsiW
MTGGQIVSQCARRDGYLGGWLSDPERAEFENHLASCPGCRQFVREQKHLDRMLAEATERLQPVPADLSARVAAQLARAGRRRRRAWAALSAAAILAAGVAAWLWLPPRPNEEQPRSPLAEAPPHPDRQTPPMPPVVQVTFPAASNVIAMPKRTGDPAVTIVWLYPTIPAARPADEVPSDFFRKP